MREWDPMYPKASTEDKLEYRFEWMIYMVNWCPEVKIEKTKEERQFLDMMKQHKWQVFIVKRVIRNSEGGTYAAFRALKVEY